MSDDYYDEDPTALRIQRVMANWPNRDRDLQHAAAQEREPRPNPQPKSKLKSADGPKTDVASFRGTVWRTATDENPRSKLYEPGDGEKVALLKNWREVFRVSHPANERARIRKGAGKGVENGAGLNGRARAGNGAARKDTDEDRTLDTIQHQHHCEDPVNMHSDRYARLKFVGVSVLRETYPPRKTPSQTVGF